MTEEIKKDEMSWGALMFNACPRCGRKLKPSMGEKIWFHGQTKWPDGKCKFVIKGERKAEIVRNIESQPVIL